MKLSQWGERWQGGFTRNISWHFHATAQLCFIELVLVSKVVSQRNVFVLRVCFPKQYLDCSISVAWLQGWQHKFVIHWPLISITEWSFVQTFMDPRTWICLTLLIVKLGGHGPHHLGSDFTQLQANSAVRKGMKSLTKTFYLKWETRVRQKPDLLSGSKRFWSLLLVATCRTAVASFPDKAPVAQVAVEWRGDLFIKPRGVWGHCSL